MALAGRVRALLQSNRSVLVLVLGTTLAQLLPVLASPILTRLFTPEEFGLFSVFSSLVLLLAVPATLRYYLAIIVPDETSRARSIANLCLLLVASFSAGILLVFLAASRWLLPLCSCEGNAALFLLVPLGILLAEGYNVFYAWSTRNREFGAMAGSRVAQGVATAGLQVATGVMRWGAAGLVVGLLAGQAVALVLLASKGSKEPLGIGSSSVPEIRREAAAFRRFPLLSLPADLLNMTANQLPVFLLAAAFGATVAGNYGLTVRVLAAPISIVATAFVSVFQERAARAFSREGNCVAEYRRTFLVLTVLSLLPLIVLLLAAPQLFAWIFGEEWRVAGEYARLMAPLYALRFVASPLSYVLYIAQKQSWDLVWQVGLLVSTAAALGLGAVQGDAIFALLLFTIAYGALYVIYLGLSWRAAQGEGRAIAKL